MFIEHNGTATVVKADDTAPTDDEDCNVELSTIEVASGDDAMNELIKWSSFFCPNDARKVFVETFSGSLMCIKPSEIKSKADVINDAHVYGWVCGNLLRVNLSSDGILSLSGSPDEDALKRVVFTCKHYNPYKMLLKVASGKCYILGEISVDGVLDTLDNIKWNANALAEMYRSCEIAESEYEELAVTDGYESCEIDFDDNSLSYINNDGILLGGYSCDRE